MGKNYGLLLLLFFCTIACNNTPEQFSQPQKNYDSATAPIRTRYIAFEQTLLMREPALEQDITLASPFTNDTLQPADVLNRITILNDSARYMSNRTSWFLLKLTNFSRFNKWAVFAGNPALSPHVFIRDLRGKNALQSLTGENRYEKNYQEPVGTLFSFKMEPAESIYLLLQFTSNEPVYLAKIKVYPYTISKYEPVNVSSVTAIARLVTIIIFLTIFFCLVYSKDYVFLIFLIYFAFYFVSREYRSVIFSRVNGFIVMEAIDIFEYGCYVVLLLFIPLKIELRNNKLLVVAFTFFLFILIRVINFNFLLHTDFPFRAWAGVLGDSSLLYIFYLYRLQIRNRFFIVIAIIIVLLDACFVFAEVIDLLHDFNLVLFFHEFIILGFFTLLLVRFRDDMKIRRGKELAKKLESQKAISSAVIRSLEDERKRISQDIHDELGGTLALIKIKLHAAVPDKEKLEEVQGMMTRAASSARAIAYELMPPYFADTDFKMLLFAHFNALNEKGNMKFNFSYSKGDYSFSKDEELMIYRIILELAHNCLKHSGAEDVLVSLEYQSGQLLLTCADDGKGMPEPLHSGIRMQSIESRVSFLNGTMGIRNTRPGCLVSIVIPYHTAV